MIGSPFGHQQTNPAGAPVSKVLVQQGLDIVQEFYVGFFSSTASFRGRYSLLLLKAAWKLKKLPLTPEKNH